MRHALRLATPLSLVWVLSTAACLQHDAPSGGAEPTPAGAPAVAASPAQASLPAADPAGARALRIRTETTIAAVDVEAAVSSLRTAVTEAGGYFAEAKTTGSGASLRAELEARIPQPKLAGFRSGLAKIGDITSDQESAEDVTEQRADLGARLRNAPAQEKRLLDLLSDRTGSLADVIAAEKALSEVRETIERLEAQSKTLEGQIAFATVKLQVVPKIVVAEPGTLATIGESAGRGVELAGEVAVGLVVLAATLGPTALLLAALGLVTYFVVRLVMRRLAARKPPVAS
jgi:hypothetical protein